MSCQFLRAEVEAVLRGAHPVRSELKPPVTDSATRVRIVSNLRALADLPRLAPPGQVATAVGIPIHRYCPAGCTAPGDGHYRCGGRAHQDAAALLFTRHLDAREDGWLLHHAVMHPVWARSSILHNETDVILATAEFALPAHLARHLSGIDAAMRAQPNAPAWLLQAQLDVVGRRRNSGILSRIA